MVLERSYILQQSFKGSEPVVLEEVCYAPHTAHRLLSVNTLTSQGYQCVIKDQESRIWNASGALVIWVIASSPKNNLHWFQSQSITPEDCDHQSFDHGSINSLVKEDPYDLWHQHFEHLSRNALQQTPTQVTGIPNILFPESIPPCKGYTLGKMHDRSYPPSSMHASCPLGLVHTDLIGPMPVEPCSCSRYVLTFIDDFSGYSLVQPTFKSSLDALFRDSHTLLAQHTFAQIN